MFEFSYDIAIDMAQRKYPAVLTLEVYHGVCHGSLDTPDSRSPLSGTIQADGTLHLSGSLNMSCLFLPFKAHGWLSPEQISLSLCSGTDVYPLAGEALKTA